jgi:hypothetical protein
MCLPNCLMPKRQLAVDLGPIAILHMHCQVLASALFLGTQVLTVAAQGITTMWHPPKQVSHKAAVHIPPGA